MHRHIRADMIWLMPSGRTERHPASVRIDIGVSAPLFTCNCAASRWKLTVDESSHLLHIVLIRACAGAEDHDGWRVAFALNACGFCPTHFGCICLHITAFRFVPCAFFDFPFRFVFMCDSFDAYTMRCIHRHVCMHSAFYGVHSQYIERTALHVIILHL